MIRLIFKLFCMIITLLVLYAIWDISRFIYLKLKVLVLDIHAHRKARKQKKKSAPVIESVQSNTLEQYNGVLERINNE